MKRIYFSTLLLVLSTGAWSQTYVWDGSVNTNFATADNWTPARNTVTANDILEFSTGTSITVNNVTTQSIAGLRVISGTTTNTTVTFTGTTGTLTITNGLTGSDLVINAGNELRLVNANITMNTNATSNISGILYVGTGRTYSSNANNGSVATVSSTGIIDNAGTVTSTTARLDFQSAGTYVHSQNGGSIPAATWANFSNLLIEGVTANIPGNLNQELGNVRWECPAQTVDIVFPTNFNNIDGELRIVSTGSGSISYASGSNMNVNGNLVIEGGYFSLSRVNAGANNQRILNVRQSVTINGGTFDIDAGTNQSGNHLLYIGNTWNRTGGTFNPDAGTVIFDGPLQGIDGPVPTTFNNIIIRSDTYTLLNVNIAVNGNLTIDDDALFDMSTFTVNRSTNGGTLLVNGSLQVRGVTGGRTGSNFPAGFTTNTLDGEIIYNGDAGTTQTIFPATYENLTLSNITESGIANKILTADMNVNGTLSVDEFVVFTPDAGVRLTNGSTNTITGQGTVKVTRITGTPDYNNQYDFDNDDLDQLTVDYAGLGAQTINGFTYGGLHTSGSGTKTLGGNSQFNNTFTIGAGTTVQTGNLNLTASSAVITINGTLDFNNDAGYMASNGFGANAITMGTNGVIRTLDALGLGPVANASFINGGGGGSINLGGLATAGTVEFYRNATSGQVITDRDYNNLTIIGSAQTKTWTPTTSRTVNGNLTISTGAPFTIVNPQTIAIKGNWSNSGILNAGTSSILFNGTTPQLIGGSSPNTFARLLIDNATGVTLQQPSIVGTELALLMGYITTTGTSLTVSATAPVNTANFAYVNGPLTKLTASAAKFEFPVGKLSAGGLRTIAVTPVGAGASSYTAEFIPSSPKALGTSLGTGLVHIGTCEYWTLNRNSGQDATVTLSWNANSNCAAPQPYVTELSSLRVARYDGAVWQNAGPATGADLTSTIAAGTITSGTVSSFSPFALASANANENPLPVVFADVKAYGKNDGVQVEWSNLTEMDVKHYEVERATNGVNFTAINTQGAKRNLNDKASYNYFDAAPVMASNYYRIRVVENTGKVVYSKILRVELGANVKKGFSLYPNPVVGKQMTISLAGIQAGKYNLNVVNTVGQVVFRKTIVAAGTGVTEMVELPAGLKAGMYTGIMTGDNFQESRLFIVQ